jgi:hypothetical protein
LAFNQPGVRLKLKTVVTPLANGETFEQTTLENATGITGVVRFLKDLEGASSAKEGAEGEGAKDGADATDGAKDGAKDGADATDGAKDGAKEGEPGKEEAEKGKEEEKPAGSEAETDIKEVDAIDSRGTRFKAYVIRRFPFPPPGQDMILVHFMGWNESSDEFIPASEESKRILPRESKTITGSYIKLDDTVEKVKKIYTDEVMKVKETKAKEALDKFMEDYPATSAAAAAATAAAMAAAAVAQTIATSQKE